MNRDRIERALREPGPRERGYSPEALPATAAELRARIPRRSRMLMRAGSLAGLAAAVATGAVVAVVLSRGFAPGPSTGGVTTAAPTSTPTAVPTPAPTASPAPVAECRAGDFAWSADPWGGAAGSRGTIVLAHAVTSLGQCEFKGNPTLILRDANGAMLIAGHAAATKITVAGGQNFQLGVSWSNWCGAQPVLPITLALKLPGDPTEVPLVPSGDATDIPPCNGPGQPSSLSGTTFEPSTRSPEG